MGVSVHPPPPGCKPSFAPLRSRMRRPLSVPISLTIAVAIAAAAAWIAATADHGSIRADIDQLWFAARAVLQGRDPYALIGPGREFEHEWPLYYPIPATLFVLPLAPFPVVVARVVMAALPAGLLAFLLARTDPRALVLFASYAFYANAWYAQWTPLMMCSLYLPALGVFFAAKPTVGAAMLAGFRDRRAVRVALLAALVPVAASFLVQPGWLPRWIAAVQANDHLRPFAALPGGAVLVLALIRWRRWEARLLLALALLPQTLHPLATLPLLLLPPTWAQRVLLSFLTWLPGLLLVREPWGPRYAAAAGFAESTQIFGGLVLMTVWFPALAMVLRLPNEGAAPAWLERRLEGWPAWLKGRAGPPEPAAIRTDRAPA